MKGYVKKIKMKRMLAMLLTAVMVLTICMQQSVSAAAPTNVKYDGGWGITDLLTNYQYIIKGDAELNNHTVGGVAIGGTLSSNNFIGDCMQSPSYASNIKDAGITGVEKCLGSTRDFYYATSDNDTSLEQKGFTKYAGYMDLPSQFPSIVQQSQTLYDSNKGLEATSALDPSRGFQMITIDFGLSESWTIPYEVLKTAKGINFINSKKADGKFDVNDLIGTQYLINVVGVNGEEVLFDGEAWLGQEGTGKIDLFVNNNKSQFLGGLKDPVDGIQCNLSGMKLIWNFPDATGIVKWNGMGGHVVAPMAKVDVISGRFEGGIIADSVKSTGQAHYFPYNSFSISAGGDKVVPKDIFIKKTYLDEYGDALTPDTQAVFALYTDSACTQVVTGAESVSVDASTGYVEFESEALGLTLNTVYYAKELAAPTGFAPNATVYACSISAGGQITYCEVGKSGFSTSIPVCENVKETYDDDNDGTLVVTVEDAKTREKLADAEITVKDSEGNPVSTSPKITSSTGVVTFANLAEGKYTVSITQIPDGYVQPATGIEAQVTVRETTYHTFELEKEKEPIKVILKDTDGNLLSGGYVRVTDSKGNSTTEWVGSNGTVIFEGNEAGNYTITLVQNPNGYTIVDGVKDKTLTVVTNDDDKTNNVCEFILEAPSVTVTVVEEGKTTVVPGAEVTITKPNGTTDKKTTGPDGKVTFTNVPVGDAEVQVTGVPTTKDYILPEDEPTEVEVVAGTDATATLEVPLQPAKGTLIINVQDTKADDNTTTGVIVKVEGPAGTIIYGDPTDASSSRDEVKVDDQIVISNTVVGPYVVTISKVPDKWKTTETTEIIQNVTVEENKIANADYTLIQTEKLTITVKDENTNQPVKDVELTVKDSEGKEHPVTSDDNGKVEIVIPEGEYTITTDDVPDGYKVPTDIIKDSIVPGVDEEKEIKITPLGSIEVTVVEKGNTSNKIQNATIVVKDANDDVVNTDNQKTSATGKVTVNDLPIGAYTVEITATPDDNLWKLPVTTSASVTVKANETATHQFELSKETGTLTIIVQEEEDVAVKIQNATVVVKDSKGNVVNTGNQTTDATGKIVINDLTVGDKYTATITTVPTDAKAYELPTVKDQEVTIVKAGKELIYEVKITPPAYGDLVIVVKDTDGNRVKDVPVTVTGPSGAEVFNNKTTASSDITLDDQLAGEYISTLGTLPDGYKLVAGYKSECTDEVNENQVTTITYILEASGDIKVTVKEDDGTKIPGAEVVLKDPVTGDPIKNDKGEDIKGTTNADGEVVFEDVPVGDYIVEIEKVPEKYDPPTNPQIPVEVEQGKTTEEEVTLEYKGEITVTVTEKGEPNVVIPNVDVKLLDASGNAVLDAAKNPITAKTNNQGTCTFTNLPDGTYQVEIDKTTVPKQYKEPAAINQTATIKDGEPVSKVFTVYGVGDLIIKVVEDGTNTPIKGAEIKVTDPENTVITTVTDDNGEVILTDQRVGEQTIVVTKTPAGYKVPTDLMSTSKVTVVKGNNIANGNPTREEFVVAPTANLTITVVDKDDQTPLANAQITVKDPYGNEVGKTTDPNGNVELKDWIVGDSTVTIVQVPQTNILPTPATTTATVVKGDDNTHKVEAPKVSGEKGDITITVTDKETGKLVPGADVQIKDPSGVITTTQTDNNGKIELKDIPTGDYTIVITDVPDGYTEPDKTPTSVTVVAGPNPTVNILIKKPVATGGVSAGGGTPASTPSKSSNEIIAKAPKTGDITYIPFAIAMMAISMVGLAGIVVYRKKTGNER